jgi:hypothetical protein
VTGVCNSGSGTRTSLPAPSCDGCHRTDGHLARLALLTEDAGMIERTLCRACASEAVDGFRAARAAWRAEPVTYLLPRGSGGPVENRPLTH